MFARKKRRLLSRVKSYLRAVCRPLQNGDFPLTKRQNTHLNDLRPSEAFFSRTYSTSTSSDSSSSGSESSSESASERSAKSPSRQNESAFEEPEVSFDKSIVTFTAEAAFKGLSKSARKSLLTDSPVPYHADLRPKKVDSFAKKDLKRNGTAFILIRSWTGVK